MSNKTLLLEKTGFVNALLSSENKHKLALQTIKCILQNDIVLYEKIDQDDYGRTLSIMDVINLALDDK